MSASCLRLGCPTGGSDGTVCVLACVCARATPPSTPPPYAPETGGGSGRGWAGTGAGGPPGTASHSLSIALPTTVAGERRTESVAVVVAEYASLDTLALPCRGRNASRSVCVVYTDAVVADGAYASVSLRVGLLGRVSRKSLSSEPELTMAKGGR